MGGSEMLLGQFAAEDSHSAMLLEGEAFGQAVNRDDATLEVDGVDGRIVWLGCFGMFHTAPFYAPPPQKKNWLRRARLSCDFDAYAARTSTIGFLTTVPSKHSLRTVRNFTMPALRAKMVWSLPRAVFLPGMMGVPRWRTMMEPTFAASPS